MFSLPEYIIVSRAARVIENAYINGLMYKDSSSLKSFVGNKPLVATGTFGINDPKYYYNLQKTLEDIISLSIPGATLTRFISMIKFDTLNKRSQDLSNMPQLPILLVEIADPHLLLPIFIGSEYVFFISPFGNSTFKEDASNYYVYPLFKTEILTDWKCVMPTSSDTYQTIGDLVNGVDVSIPTVYKVAEKDKTFGDVIKDILINKCGLPIQKQIGLISKVTNGRSYYDQETIATESELYHEIVSRYEVEAVGDSEYDTLVTPDDYMPIVIKDSNFSNNFVRCVSLYDLHNKRQLGITSIKTSVPDKHRTINVGDAKSSLIIKTNKNSRFLLSLPASMYMIPDNKVVIVDEDNIKNPIIGSAQIDETFSIYDDLDTGTESVLSDTLAGAKKVGIKVTVGLKSLLKLILKYPARAAKLIWKDIRAFFKKFDKELEKSDSLEYREKVLNDELDQTKDMLIKWTRVITFTGVTLALTGSVFFMFCSLIYWRIDDNNTRVRAINRQIKSFNEAIKRIDFKIDAARQESRYEDVDALLKEKQMLTLGRRELIQLKRKNYAKADEANKEKFGDTDTLPDEELNNDKY